MTVLPAFVSLLLAATAWAGGYDLGNPGGVAECPPPHSRGETFFDGRSTLDLLEGRAEGLTYRQLRSLRNMEFDAAFARALALFLSKYPEIKTLFAEWKASERPEFVHRLGNLSFGSFSWRIPAECRIERGALQYFRSERGRTLWRLAISNSVWKKLSTDLKVALLLHEYVLRYAFLHLNPPARAHLHLATGILLSDQREVAGGIDWHRMLTRPVPSVF